MTDPTLTPDIAAPRHELKTWPGYFAAIVTGEKTFELRRNDRDFEVGDVLVLREWDPEHGLYSGRSAEREVTYVLRNAEAFGLRAGFVVLGLAAARSASGTPTPEVDREQMWDEILRLREQAGEMAEELEQFRQRAGTAALTEDPETISVWLLNPLSASDRQDLLHEIEATVSDWSPDVIATASWEGGVGGE